MQAVTNEADLPVVEDTESRGAQVKKRFKALGVGDREWHRITGIDRKTLNRAIADASTDTTYEAIFSWLDRLERRNRGIALDLEGDYVEFTVEGNFGVRAVVKGPVKDMAELQRAVSQLVRDMRNEPQEP